MFLNGFDVTEEASYGADRCGNSRRVPIHLTCCLLHSLKYGKPTSV
jgi:hypothetical protein